MNTVRPRRHKPTSNTPKEAVLLAWFFLAPFGETMPDHSWK